METLRPEDAFLIGIGIGLVVMALTWLGLQLAELADHRRARRDADMTAQFLARLSPARAAAIRAGMAGR